MARQALHRSEIRSSVEKVRNESAPEIVRSESLAPGFDSSLPENVEHRLIRHPTCDHTTYLVDGQK